MALKTYVDAIIFDLDGVITDTAEFHFLAWKRLADEEGIPFNRADNEKLRGVSRRDSLERLLAGRQVSEAQAEAMMARKNRYYRAMLENLGPDDLLPGVSELLDELARLGIKIAIASASRNAPTVIERLGLAERIHVLVHGGDVSRQKPHPDLFLLAARRLGVPPARCVVVEDAASGIEAARTAGMMTVGLGPVERVGAADVVLPSLEGVAFARLSRASTWRVSEPLFEPARQHHRETIFTLGNGYLSTRGTFEERFPGDRQATLVHGYWDDAPIVVTELANTPDWTSLEILVNGQRFSMERGILSDYARYLDLRSGTLHRRLRWKASDEGPSVELVFERFASLDDPHLLALRCQVTAIDGPLRLEIRARLDSHVENEGLLHLQLLSQECSPHQADLQVQTRHTRKELALSTRLVAHGVEGEWAADDCPGCPGVRLAAHLRAGQTLTLEKLVAVYTSRDTEEPLAAARRKAEEAANRGYTVLWEAHQRAWAQFWEHSDVIIEGDDQAQLALRHALFQLRIAAPTCDEHVSISAKTLSGFGYRGHVFWDNEIFVLPFFIFTQPKLARNMLMYRWHTLPGARRKAAANGFSGAQYPWESAETGDEVTPAWVPDFRERTKLVRIWTGDIELHITADIAYALYQYWQITGDDDFWRDVGAPIVLETGVFWGERAEPEGERFAIRDVIGPDEYHDHVDNNVFTNRMVQWHLQTALEALQWLREHAPARAEELTEQLGLTPERLAHWRRVSENLILLQDPQTGLYEQFEGFFRLKKVDWPAFEGRTQSMQVLLGIEGANEHQVIKQADVILMLCLFRQQTDPRVWQANWDYYTPITDHTYGSSLSPAIYAWAACEIGEPEVAYEHFQRAALADLEDVRGNAGDGIHAASAGGLWQAVVFGFAGLQLSPQGPRLSPRWPAHWKRLAFNIWFRGRRYRFDLRPETP